MISKQQSTEKALTSLQEIAKGFAAAIFNQENLLILAKRASADQDMPTIEALVISIDRFNDDLFHLYERLNDMVDCEAAEGGAA